MGIFHGGMSGNSRGPEGECLEFGRSFAKGMFSRVEEVSEWVLLSMVDVWIPMHD